ncbi:MAG TPA: hypothetical protein VGC58_01550 [Candidatus Paceibacterota bacterium]
MHCGRLLGEIDKDGNLLDYKAAKKKKNHLAKEEEEGNGIVHFKS